MTTDQKLDPTNPLSPSELVLLNGDQFAKKVMMGNIQLLHTDASVSISQLAKAILAAAVLAAESVGNLQLEVQTGKAMLGLRKVKKLCGNPSFNPIDWPEFSLEAQLPKIAERLENEGENHQISDLIYIWLRQDSSSPSQSAIELVKSGLAERGMLEAAEQTRMKVFTVVKYSLPDSTASLASQYTIEQIRKVLADCESNRKDIWDLLLKEIKRAFKQRTEQDDMDFD